MLFSAHAEVFPATAGNRACRTALLRARGGISAHLLDLTWQGPSSPRTRRYFLIRQRGTVQIALFSAHAEVFPGSIARAAGVAALLRARGGISWFAREATHECNSSPRTRRYFHGVGGVHRQATLFSAHAEVFPGRENNLILNKTLLRARGGISLCHKCRLPNHPSSPRTRRYFRMFRAGSGCRSLFSAHAEVFPFRQGARRPWSPLLRARGGISISMFCSRSSLDSSPRTRRYFQRLSAGVLLFGLFSAHAEVFPYSPEVVGQAQALLRARGGISSTHENNLTPKVSSPRTRRYFHDEGHHCESGRLFSAHAEVFPIMAGTFGPSRSLLRARGGISMNVWAAWYDDSSPRTQRYFPYVRCRAPWGVLFSAHAEVFPRRWSSH